MGKSHRNRSNHMGENMSREEGSILRMRGGKRCRSRGINGRCEDPGGVYSILLQENCCKVDNWLSFEA